jgi:hypothetical protein
MSVGEVDAHTLPLIEICRDLSGRKTTTGSTLLEETRIRPARCAG